MAPTEKLLLLTSMTPPPSVNPAGGVPPAPVKNIARAGSPAWLLALDVRKSTSLESGATPAQEPTFVPQTSV
jgi:hypothetical protein